MRRLINHQETNLQNHYRSSTRAIQQDGTPNPARFFSEPWNHVDDRFYEAGHNGFDNPTSLVADAVTSRIRGTRSGPTAENAYSSDHKTLVTILHPKRDGTPEGHDVKPTYMMYLEPIEFEDGNAAEAGLHSHAWPSVNGEIANNIVSYAHEKYPRQVQDRAKTAQGAELGPETGHGTFDKNHEAFPVFAAIAEAAIDVFVSEGRFWMCSHIAFRLFLGGIQWPHAG